MSDANREDAASAGAKTGNHDQRHIKGASLTIAFMLLLGGLLMYDFRDILMAKANRKSALSAITLGARITQAERELNDAGYNTLYNEGPPTSLFISTLQHRPIVAVVISKLVSKTAADNLMDNFVRNTTGFFITANPNGSVVISDDGRPRSFDLAP